MGDQIPERGENDVHLVSEAGLIPTAAEIAERHRAEQERREQDHRQLILDLQARQTTAQALQASSNVTIARLTGALVVFSLVGGFVSYLQFRATKQSAEAALQAVKVAEEARDDSDISSGDTLLAMRAQGRAMQRTAETARDALAQSKIDSVAQDKRSREAREASEKQSRDALNASIQASRIDQRAWVNIADLHAVKEPVAGEDFVLSFSMTNTGKTPATEAVIKNAIGFDVSEPAPGSRDWSSVPTVNRGIIFPGTIIRNLTSTFHDVTEVLLFGYTMHISKLYFLTRIDYRDVFQKPHWAEICVTHAFGEPLDRFSGCSTMGEMDKTDENSDNSVKQ